MTDCHVEIDFLLIFFITYLVEIGCQLIKLIDLFDPHGKKILYGKV